MEQLRSSRRYPAADIRRIVLNTERCEGLRRPLGLLGQSIVLAITCLCSVAFEPLLRNPGPIETHSPLVVVLDEDDGIGSDFRDASYGFATGGDDLLRGGTGKDKLPVTFARAFMGRSAGVLQFRHGDGGNWEMFVASEGWQARDAGQADSIFFFINGPENIPSGEMPRLGLEDTSNRKTRLVDLSDWSADLDADTLTWQRISLPLSAFEPLDSFDPTRLKTVRFTAGAVNPQVRTLWIDLVVLAPAIAWAALDPPASATALPGDRSIILSWEPVPTAGVLGYGVERWTGSSPGQGDPVASVRHVREPYLVDFDVENDSDVQYRIRSLHLGGFESAEARSVSARPESQPDEAFLDLVQRTAFDFFWYEANPANGLIRDRSTEHSACSIASVGFGLSAVTVGIDRGWISREEGSERVLTTLEFFWNSPQGTAPDATGYRGFYYHFLDMESGKRAGLTELSTIDTALLLAGVLHAGAYFDGEEAGEARIRALSDSLFGRVEWTWIQPRAPKISMGWKPESGFLGADWSGYNEAMILYIMALGSDSYPVSPSAWNAWTTSYSWQTQYAYSFVVFPPLFGHQYSHVWIDFRGIRDSYMRTRGSDYFENSRRATLAQRAYSVANPGRWRDYGENVWGITASDTPTGYRARGAPPPQNDDGTIAPTAAGGSYAFTPDESLAALRHMYTAYLERLWWRYGFRDAFNPTRDWYASDHIGIDQGPIVLMIENGRTGRVWDVFMRSHIIQQGLQRAGFRPIEVPNEYERPSGHVPEPALLIYPVPSANGFTVRFSTEAAGPVELVLIDLLGRTVSDLRDVAPFPGTHTLRFPTEGLPAGVYLLRLQASGTSASQPVVIHR